MSQETSAESSSKEGTLSDSESQFLSSRVMDLQKELTRYIEESVHKLNGRVANLEQKLGIDKKSESDGLLQQMSDLREELHKTNAKVKELEDRSCQAANPFGHFEDSFRSVVRKELEALFKENFFEKNLKKLVQETLASETQYQNLNCGVSQSSTFTAWRRENSQDDHELGIGEATGSQAQNASDQYTNLYQRDVRRRPDDRGVRGDTQPKSLDGMLEENLPETTIRGMEEHHASHRNLEQPKSLEGRLEEDSSKGKKS